MRTYCKNDFILMPWKNGGGMTNEFLCLRDHNNQILFRISSATVSQDGPFSHFRNIHRHLAVLKGNGLKLQFEDMDITLNKLHTVIDFDGDEKIFCSLIDGECIDFNVMTNIEFGTSNLLVKNILSEEKIHSAKDATYIYLVSSEMLIHLDQFEIYHHHENQELAYIIEFEKNH